MIDIHCHILPFVDDGAAGYTEALQMLKIAQEAGTVLMVATPHCNIPGGFENYWDNELEDAVIQLRQAARNQGLQIELCAGQEVFLRGDFIDLIQKGKLIPLNKTDYMLVEFEFNIAASEAYRRLARLCSIGIKPVLAHPERYRFFIKNEEAAEHLAQLGVLFQINKDSLFGSFGAASEKTAHRLLAERRVNFVASDGHSPFARCPSLDAAHELISEVYSMDYADFLLSDNPRRLLENQKIYKF